MQPPPITVIVPDHGFDWLQLLGNGLVAVLTVVLTFWLIERRKERTEIRERMRMAAIEYLAAASRMLRKAMDLEGKRNAHDRFAEMRQEALAAKYQAEYDVLAPVVEGLWEEAFVARTKMLLFCEPSQLDAAEGFFNMVFMWNPPARADRPNKREAEIVSIRHTIEFLSAWGLRQPSSLAGKHPKYDFSLEFWKAKEAADKAAKAAKG